VLCSTAGHEHYGAYAPAAAVLPPLLLGSGSANRRRRVSASSWHERPDLLLKTGLGFAAKSTC
jgi:hypothetical protein